MVSKKSVYYGQFDGFQVPFVPKAPRSLRRNAHMKSSEGRKLCAFELLADVADRLLQESESSTLSTGQEEKEQIAVPIVKQEEPEVKVTSRKESPESDSNSGLEHVSEVKTSDFLMKFGSNVKLEPSEGKNVDKLEAVEKQSGCFTFRDSVVDSCVQSKSFSSVDLTFNKNPVSCSTRDGGNVKMGITDDNKNSSWCCQRGNQIRAFRSQSRVVGYRRITRMLNSRYRKVTPISGVKSIHKYKKKIHRRKECETETASKRRKLFHHNSSNTTYIQEETSNKVKFCIGSFTVPELYIEIPETATIGSLKKTVMEAVRDILGRELHVGILLMGKKVKDNNQTLQQTGISQSCELETLGFTLEPSSCTASRNKDVGFSNSSLNPHPTTSVDKHIDKNQENLTSSENEVLTEERLAVVKVKHKPTKKSEVSHNRRIRRPFSVTEVEALVEAVETIGTGRWRDIKLRAFDDANHRTYVDLKDKWKTLVHTASISPHQRRGEAVPQDLLDRVLAAHEYWSNHQLKQQQKHQIEPLRILDVSSV